MSWSRRLRGRGGNPAALRARVAWAVVGFLAAVPLLTGCGPKESPEQRVGRLRMQYEVRPTGFQPRTAEDGTPDLALDVLVLNKGKESLNHLTFVLRIVGPDGTERLSRPVSIDTSHCLPGVTSQVSAIVRGVELQEGDQVLLELEPQPDARERATYPEYRDALSSPA